MMELNEQILEIYEKCPFCEGDRIVGTIDTMWCIDCGELFQ